MGKQAVVSKRGACFAENSRGCGVWVGPKTRAPFIKPTLCSRGEARLSATTCLQPLTTRWARMAGALCMTQVSLSSAEDTAFK